MENLNINNNEWLIVDGTLKEYRGKSKNIIIPEGVIKISVGVFEERGLESVEFPETLEEIWNSAFMYNQLTAVKLPKKVKEIGERAFSENKINSLELPSLKKIRWSAFRNNRLNNIVIPEGVEVIEEGAFEKNKLQVVTLPKTLKIIEDHAFSGNNIKCLTIPENVEEIGWSAFYNNSIESLVILGNGLTCIGVEAFYANAITSLNLPCSLKNIMSEAFNYNRIEVLTIPCIKFKDFNKAFSTHNIEVLVLKERIPASELIKFVLPNLTELVLAYEPTILEILSLKKRFKNVKITIKQSKEELNVTSEDKEVNSLVKKILSFSSFLQPNMKEQLNNYLNELLLKYEKDLEALKPILNFERKDFGLSLESARPQDLRANLINTLERIYNNLSSKEKARVLIEKIKKYQELITQEELEEPVTFNDIESRIKYMIIASKKYNINDMAIKLQQILNETLANLSEEISQIFIKGTSLTLEYEDETTFNLKIEQLFEEFIAKINFYQALNGEGNSVLAQDLQKLKCVIAYLDNSNQEIYNEKLKEVLEEIKKSLDTEKCLNVLDLEIALREKLQTLLIELSNLIPKITVYKDLLNDLNNSLAVINGEDLKYPAIITNYVLDIINILSSPLVTTEDKKETHEKLQNVITNWINNLLNNQAILKETNECLEYLNIKDDIGKSLRLYFEKEAKVELRIELSNIFEITLMILKELSWIKFELENYLINKEEYLNIPRRN